jgi:dCTP deaminase
MIKSDIWIKKQANNGMIVPFSPSLINKNDKEQKIISYGTTSFGYDLRLSPKDFRIFKNEPEAIVDSKNFNPNILTSLELQSDESGEYFIMPPLSYGLGVAIETLKIPRNILVICVGKSSLARVGIIANVTPAEPEWEGKLTLEFKNSLNNQVKIYANEGVLQILFLEGQSCEISYKDRNGKYQNQTEEVTLVRV